MNEYDKLQAQFEKKVERLQETCPHTRLGDWIDEWWAFGHSTGFEVRCCVTCSGVGRRRTTCRKCEKVTEDYVDGNKKNKRPIGEYLCRACDSKFVSMENTDNG